MTRDQLKKANELTSKINELEDFMFWCSGRREGFRKYPAAIIKLKRRWQGCINEKTYDLPQRLQNEISKCVEEELKLLNEELDSL